MSRWSGDNDDAGDMADLGDTGDTRDPRETDDTDDAGSRAGSRNERLFGSKRASIWRLSCSSTVAGILEASCPRS